MEIGVRSGVSTSALLAGIEAHGGHLYSFDLNHCDVFHGHQQWTFTQGDSIGEADKIKQVIPSELDVLFVDGDHTYEGALADLNNFGPLAKRIFVHDTDAPDFPGVRRAVDEFAKHAKRQVTYHSGSYGMAEIQ
jgi:hypothetical protein